MRRLMGTVIRVTAALPYCLMVLAEAAKEPGPLDWQSARGNQIDVSSEPDSR